MITDASLEESYGEFCSALQEIRSFRMIYIYGAGGWGMSLQKLLKTYGIDIVAFFDQNADENDQQKPSPVYNLDRTVIPDYEKNDSLVIIAVKLESQKSVAYSLAKHGFRNVTTINGIWHYGCWFEKAELFSLITEKENILKCVNIWEDKKSLDVYRRQIECYLTRKYNISNQIHGDQYFPRDIHFRKGYHNFVDCGAYTGDTIATLIHSMGKINKLVALEPDKNNFKKLTSYISHQKERVADNIYLYPCGSWSSSKMVAFNSTRGPSSHISESGDTFLQCVSLDDVLFGFTPTFIKMDIEGAELEAVKGACSTIDNHKPSIAISVYHRIEHTWEIPLLLKRINNDYQFHLRSHEHFNQETVLYAV